MIEQVRLDPLVHPSAISEGLAYRYLLRREICVHDIALFLFF